MRKLTHGGDWAGFAQEYGAPPRLDFSANISPLGIPGGVQKAVEAAIAGQDRYPDPLCRDLCAAIGEKRKIPRSWVLCGNGAADLIWRLALAGRFRRALVPAPTFAEYAAALRSMNCEILQYPLQETTNFALDEGILSLIRPGLDLLILCEPNNPTGRTTDRTLMQQILKRCAVCGTLLAVDECFNEFLDRPEQHTLERALKRHANLLILKAFTKWYAMAGLRLGYALSSNTALLEKMRNAGQPWAVSGPAQAAGLAALKEEKYSAALHSLILCQRPRLADGLRALGCRVVPGEANYLLFYHRDVALAEKLRGKGVLVRECQNYPGLGPGWYRAAVRTEKENGLFLQTLKEVL